MVKYPPPVCDVTAMLLCAPKFLWLLRCRTLRSEVRALFDSHFLNLSGQWYPTTGATPRFAFSLGRASSLGFPSLLQIFDVSQASTSFHFFGSTSATRYHSSSASLLTIPAPKRCSRTPTSGSSSMCPESLPFWPGCTLTLLASCRVTLLSCQSSASLPFS